MMSGEYMSYLQIVLPQHCGRACCAFFQSSNVIHVYCSYQKYSQVNLWPLFGQYAMSYGEELEGGLDSVEKKKGAVWFDTVSSKLFHSK